MEVWQAFQYLFRVVVIDQPIPDKKAQEALGVICDRLRAMDAIMEDVKKLSRKEEGHE